MVEELANIVSTAAVAASAAAAAVGQSMTAKRMPVTHAKAAARLSLWLVFSELGTEAYIKPQHTQHTPHGYTVPVPVPSSQLSVSVSVRDTAAHSGHICKRTSAGL